MREEKKQLTRDACARKQSNRSKDLKKLRYA